MANSTNGHPRKYWWVVAVAVPIALALIAIVPSFMPDSGSPGTGPTTTIEGNNNTVTYDYSTHQTFVTNVSVIAREYQAQTGQPLDDRLRRKIESAVDAALANDHAESIRLFEQLAEEVPVPAIYNNLGVEYAKTRDEEASKRAFALSRAKIAEAKDAAARNQPLPPGALKAPRVSGPAVRTEPSVVPAMVIESLSAPYEAPGEIHVVAHGTATGGSYQVKYEPEFDATVAMDPGAYDVLLKASSYGAGFLLASNVVVREGALIRINSNALVGGLAIDSVSHEGFPAIKTLQLVDAATGDRRLLAQQTEKLGVTLPLAPGTYNAVGVTVDGQVVQLATSIAVEAGTISRLDPLKQISAIIVRMPNVPLDVKAIYALTAGTNQIAGKVDGFDRTMVVPAGAPYDIALEQSAGLTRIRSGIVPGAGEVVEIK